jgi:HK97 family phage prohead protease
MQKVVPSLKVKSLSERQFEGHGSIFGNVDLGDDVVLPGAFARSLAERKSSGILPGMFWMHDPGRVAGKWLDMKEDKRGLWVKGELAPTPLGDEVHALMKMDAVNGLSIGFQIRDQDYDRDGVRVIKEVDLWEVSVVSLPMNPLARVTHVKTQTSGAGEYVPTPKEFERILRDAGCSRSVAKQLIHLWMEAKDEPAERAEPSQREAVDADISGALASIADRMMAEAIRLKFAA